jgi:hypothetical protein
MYYESYAYCEKLPMVNDTICAPGATPFFSGLSRKYAAAIEATWVPWLAEIQNTM